MVFGYNAYTTARTKARTAVSYRMALMERPGHREILQAKGDHLLIAKPREGISVRGMFLLAVFLLVGAIVLFALSQTFVPPRLSRHAPPNWYFMGSMACVGLALTIFFGAAIKSSTQQALVFDRDAGIWYPGRYQGSAARPPVAARPLGLIQSVACYRGYKLGQVNVVLSEPEGKVVNILEPSRQWTPVLAAQLAEFLGVPVVDTEEPADNG
jgi:hypothetical protein